MKTIIFSLIFIANSISAFSQIETLNLSNNRMTPNKGMEENSILNYGFDLRLLYTNKSISIREGCQVKSLNGDYFFIDKENKIMRLFFHNNNWVVEQVGAGTAVVAPNTQLTTVGDNSLVYVRINRIDIYELVYLNNVPIDRYCFSLSQPNKVRINTDLTYNEESQTLFLINDNNQIYSAIKVTNYWNQPEIVGNNSQGARVGTNIIFTVPLGMYYVGLDNLIYEMLYQNGIWVNGNSPLFNNGMQSQVCSETEIITDGWNLFYVGTKQNDFLIYNLFWRNEWQLRVLPSYSVRKDVTMVYSNYKIYYVSNFNCVCASQYVGNDTWSSQIISNYDNEVRTPLQGSTNLIVYERWISEEGTENYFLSPHVFYININNGISCLINDYDYSCHHWDYYYCDECKDSSGNFRKTWYNTPLFMSLNNNGSPIPFGSILSLFGTSISFVGDFCRNPYFYVFDRNVCNNNIRHGEHLIFSDEFSDSKSIFNHNASMRKWNQQFPQSATQWEQRFFIRPFSDDEPLIEFKQFEGEENKYISLQQIRENYDANDLYWAEWDTTFPNCTTTKASVKIAQIHSGKMNCRHLSHNNFDCNFAHVSDCAPENVPEKLFFQYGFIETRCKFPRGSKLNSAFWLLPGDNDWKYEIDMFENPGNGNMLLMSTYIEAGTYEHHYAFYPVGFRYHDNFYTYGLRWEKDALDFYFNNQYLGSITEQIPDTLMYMLVTNGYNETWATCEIEPEKLATFDLDYIRVYQTDGTPSKKNTDSMEKIEQNVSLFNNTEIHISGYPNPVNNIFTITFSETISYVELSIYNILGCLIEKLNFYNTKDAILDFSTKDKSYYFIKVKIDGMTKILKVIK